MKTALKLLLLSASFVSSDLYADYYWKLTPEQPGTSGTVTSLVMSADCQTYLVAERQADRTLLWRSLNAGKNWAILTLFTAAK
jgi:hypothetical protein